MHADGRLHAKGRSEWSRLHARTLPVNLLVAALGCSHSTWPLKAESALTCNGRIACGWEIWWEIACGWETAAEGALTCCEGDAPLRERSSLGTERPLRLVSPSSDFVSM